MDDSIKRILLVLLLLFVGILSMTFLAEKYTSVETYEETITSLNEKSETVLKLSAASTVAAAALSAIPDDTATPIAEKLADLTEDFLIILCVLYTEKYILTILGAAAFKVLIPIACLLGIIALLTKTRKISKFVIKTLIIGSVISFIVPCSVFISDKIYDTYQTSFEETLDQAEAFSDEANGMSDEDAQTTLSTILSSISGTFSNLLNRGARILNSFVEAIAVLIVTTCLIPVIVLVLFLWLIKQLTGLEIPEFKLKRHGRDIISEHRRQLPDSGQQQ